MKVSSRTYSLSIERHEDRYLAYFPTLPGCHTWGKTYEAAVRNAEEALELYLETLLAHGDPIPDDQAISELVSLGITVRTQVIS
ncbi:MAG: type II toxin-antitoxin system HicB family antitoxin [Methylovirgula sp.]|jgi:predicted RNase H-like HicB family nuclease